MKFEEKRLLLKPDFCFYHVPKCGGSTIRATLHNFFSKIYKKYEILYNQLKQSNTTNED